MAQGLPQADGGVPPARPHTILPSAVLTVDSDVLAGMDEFQLRQFADENLSIAFPVGTTRAVMLTKIVNTSLVVPDMTDDNPPWE